MPSKRRVSAPPNRVYKSATPLRQAKLPGARTRVGYGKQAGRRVTKALVDNKLTQMDFVVLTQRGREVDEEDDDGDVGEGSEEEEGYVQERKRGSKRRRTMGGKSELEERVKNYHTQTITQLDWSFNSAMDVEDDETVQGNALEDLPEDVMDESSTVHDDSSSSKARKSTRKSKLPKASRVHKKKHPVPVPKQELDTQGRDIYDGPYSSDKNAKTPLKTSRKRVSTPIQEVDSEQEGVDTTDDISMSPKLEKTVKKFGPRKGSRRKAPMPVQELHSEEEENEVFVTPRSSPVAVSPQRNDRALRSSTKKTSTTAEDSNIEGRDISNAPSSTSRRKMTDNKVRESKQRSSAPVVAPEQDQDMFDGPFSSSPTKSGSAPKNDEQPLPSRPANEASTNSMLPPPTPHRPIRKEIPSSQSPAFTPLSATRTPLRDQPINSAPIPFHATRTPKVDTFEPPRLEVKDTFATSTDASNLSEAPSPVKKSSPSKSVRFIIPGEKENAMAVEDDDDDPEEDLIPDSPSKTRGTGLPRPTRVPHATQRVVIQDSDEDSDLDEEETVIAESGPVEQAINEETTVEDDPVTEDGVVLKVRTGAEDNSETAQPLETSKLQLEPETCYGDIGLETQVAANRYLEQTRKSPVPEIVEKEKDNEGEEEEEDDEEQIHSPTFKERTQAMESQRLSTQQVLLMAPRTTDSDAFISASHLEVAEILDRTRDYLFRAWVLPSSVCRIWIYETQPTSTLKYMAELGPTKKPGEDLMSETGKGNATFHKKSNKWRAYAISELYELADPMSLAQLRSNEWLGRAPTKFTKVPPAVLHQMMANLLPPLWSAAEIGDEDLDVDLDEDLGAGVPSPAVSRTDTEEAASQLHHTIRQFTQPALVPSSTSSYPSSPPIKIESQYTGLEIIENSQREETPIRKRYAGDSHSMDIDLDAEVEERIPSSQKDTPRVSPPGPSQATTVDLTQTQTPRHRSGSEVIFESPIRPVAPSSPIRLPTPKASDGVQPLESLVPYSMGSSEIMTKSQMLPESLMAESLWERPPVIMDSDEDYDD
ncbi:hypothetical protein HYALB_00004697 [Hymenoscyphus albidus]|uniref:Uncharacterized protein n=1 Tax=Hymenoscyphus albidus TaxID=595503 RepID=A0A9N9LUJ8_9HELO|nr:hypothetical protein HYALB_00004697 [Hymenoscyphus albidus]